VSLSHEDQVERYKISIDYLKHITTLSTGSIILIATFLEKLFSKPLWKIAVIISLSGFMLSVFCATVSYSLGLAFSFPGEHGETPGSVELIGGLFIVATWVGFLAGVLSLSLFAIRNLVQ
jgi:hypothetical protein